MTLLKNHKIPKSSSLPDPGPQPARYMWEWRYLSDEPGMVRGRTKYITQEELVKRSNPEYNTIIVENNCLYVYPDAEGGNKPQVYKIIDEA